MNRTAYVVGFFKGGALVRVGVFSEPSPTIANGDADDTNVLATVTDADFGRATRRAQRLLRVLQGVIAAAPARTSPASLSPWPSTAGWPVSLK